jgi:hypothetical protein
LSSAPPSPKTPSGAFARHQTSGAILTKLRFPRILFALAAAILWGMACGAVRTPFLVVATGGLLAAGFGFWLERSALLGPETTARKDFTTILAAACGFFAVIGVGLASLGVILGHGLLQHLARR